MNLIIATLIIFSGTMTWAETKDLSGYQKLDMKQFDNVNAQPKDSGIKFSTNCIDDNGTLIKETDPGYDVCLSKAKNSKVKESNKTK